MESVALHVRAWVEIITLTWKNPTSDVALHVRAWVEICWRRGKNTLAESRPPCEGVGRNLQKLKDLDADCDVALHVRAWVEIGSYSNNVFYGLCRPPCEGVGRNNADEGEKEKEQKSPSM